MPSQVRQRAREPPSVLLASEGLGIIRDTELCRLFRARNNRHAFVVRRILLWQMQGMDVDQHMLALSTYVGHAHVTDTYWYLSAVPEFMAVAAERLESMNGAAEVEHG